MSTYNHPEIYDLLHAAIKNYEQEATNIISLVDARLPEAATLLDVGCGTGLHLSHLQKRFRCMGIDLSAQQLAIARDRLKGIPLIEGDMRDFHLEEQFDVITCLFGAIGYMRTKKDLVHALRTMGLHLRSGGILILEPWYFTTSWIPGLIVHETLDYPDLKISRMTSSSGRGRLSRMEMVYMIGKPESITTFRENHTMGLFSKDEYLFACAAAGFDAEYLPTAGPRGQFIASRRAASSSLEQHQSSTS